MLMAARIKFSAGSQPATRSILSVKVHQEGFEFLVQILCYKTLLFLSLLR